MTFTCEWCGSKLDCSRFRVFPRQGAPLRLCLTCATSEMMKVPIKLRNFLDDMNIPVVLVDANAVVQVANIHTSALLKKSLSHIEGNLGGDVFECAYAKLPERCGNTVHCSGCTIRNAITDTHTTGRPLSRIPATLMQCAAGEPYETHFHISTEKLSNYVILTINA